MQKPLPNRSSPPKVVAAYTAYPWAHALCSLRLVEPLREAGMQLLRGNDHTRGTSDPALVSQADIVVIQRDFPRYRQAYDQVVARARQEAKPVVYEIDDLLLEIPKEHPDYSIHYYSPAVFPMLRAAYEADLVTTTTSNLAGYLRPFNPNVAVLPNYLVDRYWSLRAPVVKPAEAPVIIGYLGSTSHLPDLAEVVPALQQLLQKYGSGVQIKFWGIKPPPGLNEFPNVTSEDLMIPDYEKFASYCSNLDCDIFIAPLKESFFNSCKSSIKYLEYSSLGIPGVYGRVAPYISVIQEGVNGFLATTTDEWVKAISRLVDDPGLREAVACQAQQTLRQDWLLSQHSQDWAQAYQAVCDMIPASGYAPRHDEIIELFLRLDQQVEDWQETLKAQLKADVQQIHDLKIHLAEQERRYQAQLDQREAELQEIKSSRVWKLVKYIWGLRASLIPSGSRAERLLGLNRRR